MKNKLKLFFILIILSTVFYSCYPLSPNGYGDQGRGQRDRHHSHQEDSRDHGDRNYN
jgi:hypothetical protein